MTKKQEKLYKATRGSSLFDYCLFNVNNKNKKKNNEKNDFLTLLLKSLTHSQWFDISKFTHLGSKPFDKEPTHVPFADKEVKKDEFNTLTSVFSQKEISELITIIENLKSYGVTPIKELMDNENESNKIISMKTAFIKLFNSKK